MTRFPTLDPALRAALLAPRPGPVDVVIDSDAGNEIDDQFAVAWALRRPARLRLAGLTACPFGLSPALVTSGAMLAELDFRRLLRRLGAAGVGPDRIPEVGPGEGMRFAEAELAKLVKLAGAEAHCPVYAGATRHLPSATQPVDSPAARFLVETAHAPREGPLYVAAIGCATNVASALLLDPGIVSRIVVVWVAAYPSFWPHRNASYNLAQDPPAACVLLDSGVPLVYVPGYYVAEELRVTRAETAQLLCGSDPLAAYLGALHEKHAARGPGPVQSKVLWDLAAVAWLLEPAWFTDHRVETPRLSEALCWVAGDATRPPMIEVVDVDRDAVFEDFYAAFTGAGTLGAG